MSPGTLTARFRERWQALNQTRKIISVLVAAGILVCLIYLGQLLARPAYAPLFTGLEPRDAGAIVEKLKAMKVPYEIADQGKTIKVPEAQVYDTRLQLASSGTLGGGMGFELFDQNKFGQTDFEQQVGYQRALQGELQRTISQLAGVEDARVHLVLPQKSVFISESVPPSASVVLKLKAGTRLKPEQVQGVSDLLVGSVEGLKTENVHIIDTEGNVLSDNLKSGEPGALLSRASLEQQKAQREYEKELENRVRQMLTKVLGPNQSEAMVTAELDFSQRQTTTNTSTNPDNLRISEHTIRETGTGTDGAGGVAGTGSNVTTYPGTQGGASSYNKEENTINYQVNTRQETVVGAPGSVRRLSAAVVVNEAAGPVDVQKVREVVAAAIGYDPNRGDQINVSGMAFDNSYLKKAEAEMAEAEARAREREKLFTYALAGAVLLALLLALAALLARRRRAAGRYIEAGAEELVPLKAAEMEQEQLPREDKQQKIRDIARDKPDEVAEILKVWIKE